MYALQCPSSAICKINLKAPPLGYLMGFMSPRVLFPRQLCDTKWCCQTLWSDKACTRFAHHMLQQLSEGPHQKDSWPSDSHHSWVVLELPVAWKWRSAAHSTAPHCWMAQGEFLADLPNAGLLQPSSDLDTYACLCFQALPSCMHTRLSWGLLTKLWCVLQ